jgi:hypothetical protein
LEKEKLALKDRWSFERDSIHNEFFYDRKIKRWPFNTGDCLIEVT